jgi:hypothetical protein
VGIGFLEKENHSFSSWTITQNTTASRNNLKYMDLVAIQYYLVLDMILLFLIPPIKIKIIIVNLDSLTNLPKDSITIQMKPRSIWLDPTTSKPQTSKSSKSSTDQNINNHFITYISISMSFIKYH